MLTDEIKTRLTEQSLVATGYTVMRAHVPATPDKVIVLREGGGSGTELFLGSSTSVEQPSLQVIVRGIANDYDGPRLQAERIFQAVLTWGAFTVSGVRYLGLTPLQAPFPIRKDENERYEFSVNFFVQKELSPTS